MTSSDSAQKDLENAAKACAEEMLTRWPDVAARELIELAFMRGTVHGVEGLSSNLQASFAIAQARKKC